MADEQYEPPKSPAAPKKNIAEPAKARRPGSDLVAAPGNTEGFTAHDLATQSSGPIGNKKTTEDTLRQQGDARWLQQRALRRQEDKIMSKPYSTTPKPSVHNTLGELHKVAAKSK